MDDHDVGIEPAGGFGRPLELRPGSVPQTRWVINKHGECIASTGTP